MTVGLMNALRVHGIKITVDGMWVTFESGTFGLLTSSSSSSSSLPPSTSSFSSLHSVPPVPSLPSQKNNNNSPLPLRRRALLRLNHTPATPRVFSCSCFLWYVKCVASNPVSAVSPPGRSDLFNCQCAQALSVEGRIRAGFTAASAGRARCRAAGSRLGQGVLQRRDARRRARQAVRAGLPRQRSPHAVDAPGACVRSEVDPTLAFLRTVDLSCTVSPLDVTSCRDGFNPQTWAPYRTVGRVCGA